MSQSEIPLMEFSRASDSGSPAQPSEARHGLSASWSGPTRSTSDEAERKTDPDDGLDYSLDELRSKYEDVYDHNELLEYFRQTCRQKHATSNFSELVPDEVVLPASLVSSGATCGPAPDDAAFQSFSLATPKATSEADDADFAMMESMIEDKAWKVWGYPASALRLLYNLEEFQKRELSPASPHLDIYALLPEELLRVERATSTLDGSPCPASSAGGRSDEVDQSSCSSHFFWAEVLYDYHSGRHPSSQGADAGSSNGSARPAFDMEAPVSGRGYAGCELQ